MKNVQAWIDTLAAKGRLYFSKEDALAALSLTDTAFLAQARRLCGKEYIAFVGNGFYVIVPPEYRSYGCFQYSCLPAHWLIDPYFRHLQKKHYIGLLSAASFYGATHQQPMVFQVMVEHARRPLLISKKVKISFYQQSHMDNAHVQEKLTPTGVMCLSSRYQTMIDLVSFYKQAGYLDNVALVIRDLIEEDVTPKNFEIVLHVAGAKPPVMQRLGYILDELGAKRLSSCVLNVLNKKPKIAKALFKPEAPSKTGIFNKKWQLIINDPLDIESHA